MSMTYQQARLVKATIPALREDGERITTLLYKNMLRDHPELNNYFNSVNHKNHRQPRALTSIILAFASSLNYDISELIPKLERMCNKHCSLGVKPEHYEIIGKYLIQAFAVVLGPAMTPETEVAWGKAYWILAKMLIGRESQLYRQFGKWQGWRPFKIDRKESETDDMTSFYLTPADRKPLPSFLPGQYVSIQINIPSIGYLQSRQYSLSDSPDPNYYRVTIKRDPGVASLNHPPGLVTGYLFDSLAAGDMVGLTHPAGEFYLDTDNASSVPVVLISAGVGCAPMMAMLNTMVETQPQREISWVHGARRAVPFYDHIRDAKRRCPRLRTNIFKTHLADGDLAGVNFDYDFRVDLAKVGRDDLFLAHGGTEYFICGPEQFMVEMADYLKSQGVPLKRLKFELFSTGDMVPVK